MRLPWLWDSDALILPLFMGDRKSAEKPRSRVLPCISGILASLSWFCRQQGAGRGAAGRSADARQMAQSHSASLRRSLSTSVCLSCAALCTRRGPLSRTIRLPLGDACAARLRAPSLSPGASARGARRARPEPRRAPHRAKALGPAQKCVGHLGRLRGSSAVLRL